MSSIQSEPDYRAKIERYLSGKTMDDDFWTLPPGSVDDLHVIGFEDRFIVVVRVFEEIHIQREDDLSSWIQLADELTNVADVSRQMVELATLRTGLPSEVVLPLIWMPNGLPVFSGCDTKNVVCSGLESDLVERAFELVIQNSDSSEVSPGIKALRRRRIKDAAPRTRPALPIPGRTAPANATNGPTMAVLGPAGSVSAENSTEFRNHFEGLVAPNRMPLATVRGVEIVRSHLYGRWPHARKVIDRILASLREGGVARLPPVLLVGSPGSGKTRLLREIAESLALQPLIYPCGGLTDAAFGGTSSQWTSRRASVPLEHIRASRIANPVIILDEIEKGASGSVNGSFVDVVLQFLERETACRHLDPGLEAIADLSGVSYLATANSLRGRMGQRLPKALVDRFTVIRMPEPDAKAVAIILPRMIAEIQIASGTHPRNVDILDEDEIAMIAKAWRKGSLRRLRKATEIYLRVRADDGDDERDGGI